MYPYLDTENNLCVEDCSILKTNKITKGNHCISTCTPSEGYIQIKEKKVYCVDECEEPNKKHYTNIGETNDFDNICREKCENYIKYSDRNICLDTCNGKYIIENNEKICYEGKTACLTSHPYYYEDINNLCLESCFPGDFILIDSSGKDLNKCVKQCPSEDDANYYIYDYDYSLQDNSYKGDACVPECSLTNKKIKRENYHCDISCDENPLGDYYQNLNSQCKKVCDNDYKKIYGNMCQNSCKFAGSVKNYEDIKDDISYCIEDCQYSVNNNFYYLNDEFKCINEYSNYIIDSSEYNKLEKICDNNGYVSDGQCVSQCPKGKIFIKDESGKNVCLNYCPQNDDDDYKYYTNNGNMHICQKQCSAYVDKTLEDDDFQNLNNLFLCLGDECSGIYPYFIIDGENKKCYRKCPENFFYKDNNFECLPKCPEGEDNYIPYKNSQRCIKEIDCNYIYQYKIEGVVYKQCVAYCSKDQIIYLDNSKFYCLDKCSDYNNLVQYTEKECVSVDNIEEGKWTNNNGNFECLNLFYKEETRGIKICLNKDETDCSSQLEYPYLLYGNYECTNKCDGILSLNGDICYPKNYEQIPNNSEKRSVNDIEKIYCKYKFYQKEIDGKKEMICLGENEECPKDINRDLLIKETNECVEYCPFEKNTKLLDSSCLSSCPSESKEIFGECFCINKYYMKQGERICVDKCKEDYFLNKGEESSECLNSCKDTEYPYYYYTKCIQNCNNIDNVEQI